MNSSIPINRSAPIADVQGRADDRAVPIDQVGIRDLRHPISLTGRDGVRRHSVGDFTMTVALSADRRGTHMSRFVELLNQGDAVFDVDDFEDQTRSMTDLLDAATGHLTVSFPFFVNKRAPVSGVASLCEYAATLSGVCDNGSLKISREVIVPVTSLCPCSKEVSDYGAHNQRSLVTVSAHQDAGESAFSLEDLIDAVEAEASSEVYPVLKRSDEKLVTERAYDNPKFVEDMVRDIAIRLRSDNRLAGYRVVCENLESIHNHSAYAVIENGM